MNSNYQSTEQIFRRIIRVTKERKQKEIHQDIINNCNQKEHRNDKKKGHMMFNEVFAYIRRRTFRLLQTLNHDNHRGFVFAETFFCFS